MQHKDDLATPVAVIRDAAPGLYSLKELYGDQWEWVRRPRACGRWFRLAVLAGAIPRASWVRRRSNRSHEYEVHQRAD